MTCPICSKKSEPAWRPFCSKRCADIDLARWLGEGYRIAASDSDDEGAVGLPDGENQPPKGH